MTSYVCHMTSLVSLFLYAEVIIGFVREEDTVLEEAGSSEICIQVQNSIMLERSVVVQFSTADGSATSKISHPTSEHTVTVKAIFKRPVHPLRRPFL